MGIRVEERTHEISAIGKAAISCGTLNPGQHWPVLRNARRKGKSARNVTPSVPRMTAATGSRGLGG